MRDVEIPTWLKGLPFAPEFRPSDTEFADPIAYISKIEKEASVYGICKIIPPLPKPSKKYVISNLKKSLSKSPELLSDLDSIDLSRPKFDRDKGNGDAVRAVFTTRQQELGQNVKKAKGPTQPSVVHKQVWQSGEVYTLEQFESKSKVFARSILSTIKEVSPIVVEALFWEASSEKPIYVEYANDVPGSGFGEPQEKFSYFQKRRRKKSFNRNTLVKVDSDKDELGRVTDSQCLRSKDTFTAVGNPDPSQESAKASTPPASLDGISPLSRQAHLDVNSEMEGSSGWKLANSPWNLQVIARSAGSLTRFMPDDIPGVTSPMVYIGMLFSWFAWHIEDHELHSLNFLHIGSPKTWYAVPGEYASSFEEVIRRKSNGGSLDHLAALSLLGEKTTLLSPEVIVESGIPCCRLVQNPGEFVVTFPRAYHVGFSHGFNCGEAANFGTPQWLKVAKDAAVRRAAMNYLPMLSHQQLLYLLTMSFVSRIPRALLPGARSSRLRNRQKEERELSVKKAFIDDILNENKLAYTLLGKQAAYSAVLWHPDSLISPSKESKSCKEVDCVVPTTETDSFVHSKNDKIRGSLFDEMRAYMETMNSLYLDDDDISSDFQVDSGTLACVACGVLGFPFMCILQPSERAYVELVHVDCPSIQKGSGVSELIKSPASQYKLDVSENMSTSTVIKIAKGWSSCSSFLRPRIFCLEHAIQIEELFQSKGGTNVLVICHSDYQKMKAHAEAIAEEIGECFNYHDILLGSASQEDLHLINLALDGEEHDPDGEDWSSKVGINLQYCVKVKKNFPSKQINHALRLRGLIDGEANAPHCANVKWQSRRSRSKHKLNHHSHLQPCESIHKEKIDVLEGGSETKEDNRIHANKEEKLIQYSRRKYKNKQGGSAEAGAEHHILSQHEERPSASCMDVSKDSMCSTRRPSASCMDVSKDSMCSTRSNVCHSASVGNLEMQHQMHSLQAAGAHGMNSVPVAGADLHAAAKPTFEMALLADHQTLEKRSSGIVTVDGSGVQQNLDDTEGSNSFTIKATAGDATTTMHVEDQNGEVINQPKNCPVPHLGNSELLDQYGVEAVEDVLENKGLTASCVPGIASEARSVLLNNTYDEACDSTNLDSNDHQEISIRTNMQESGSSYMPPDTGLRAISVEVGDAIHVENSDAEDLSTVALVISSPDSKKGGDVFSVGSPLSNSRKGIKRKREVEVVTYYKDGNNGYIRGPCEGLRPRFRQDPTRTCGFSLPTGKKAKSSPSGLTQIKNERERRTKPHCCDLESCLLSFKTKAELVKHKHNQCTIQGCGKRLSSHKYTVLHQRVHDDKRPLRCPWEGCKMSFKWAWSRTEHLRVHTGERPYHCEVDGCGLKFRYISDFNRHRRKTGHYSNLGS